MYGRDAESMTMQAQGAMLGAGLQNQATMPPQREPQIHNAAQVWQRRISELDALTQQLTERLCHVLRPCAPSPGGTAAGKEIREVRAPLADMIDQSSGHVAQVNMRLADILDRLEI